MVVEWQVKIKMLTVRWPDPPPHFEDTCIFGSILCSDWLPFLAFYAMPDGGFHFLCNAPVRGFIFKFICYASLDDMNSMFCLI